MTYTASKSAAALVFTPSGTDMPAPPPGRSAMALTGTIESFSYALTAGEGGSDAWSAGIKYDPGTFYVSAGADSNDVLAIGAGGTFSGFIGKATYVKQDGETYWAHISAYADPVADTGTAMTKQEMVNEMEAYGLSVSRDIGAGSNIALAYSRLTDKNIPEPLSAPSNGSWTSPTIWGAGPVSMPALNRPTSPCLSIIQSSQMELIKTPPIRRL